MARFFSSDEIDPQHVFQPGVLADALVDHVLVGRPRPGLRAEGEILIPEMYNDRVCVHDRDGKLLRQISVPQPIAALALPGGKVLVTSMKQMRAIEIDRAGKEVWEYKRDTRVTRAVRY